VDVATDHLFNLRLGHELENPGNEQVKGDRENGVRIVQLVCELPFGIERVVLGHDGADPIHSHVRYYRLREIGQDHRHLVPFFYAQPDQRAGELVHQSIQLTVGDLSTHIVEGDRVRMVFCRSRERRRDGELFKLQAFRYAWCI